MKSLKKRLAAIAASIACSSVFAADIYVDSASGDDKSASGPFKTIAKALSKAGPGDTVNLAKGQVFKESVKIGNFAGEPGRPLTVDGHGALINGLVPLDLSLWAPAGEGLFKSESFYRNIISSGELSSYKGDPKGLHYRFFFVFDGKMQRMGRTCKARCAPFKKPEALAPGEWTFDEGSSAYYIKTDGRSLADCKIEYPSLLNGVALSGNCSNIVIRGIAATGVVNDGFNIHGRSSNLRFESIVAFECGDDGVSAHEECDFDLDGFASYGNATGVCNIGKSKCGLSRMRLEGAVTKELYSMDEAVFDVRDSFVDASSGEMPVSVAGNNSKGFFSKMKLRNVAIVNLSGSDKLISVQKSCSLEMDSCGALGIAMRGSSEDIKLADTLLSQPGNLPSMAALKMPGQSSLDALLKTLPPSARPAGK